MLHYGARQALAGAAMVADSYMCRVPFLPMREHLIFTTKDAHKWGELNSSSDLAQTISLLVLELGKQKMPEGNREQRHQTGEHCAGLGFLYLPKTFVIKIGPHLVFRWSKDMN